MTTLTGLTLDVDEAQRALPDLLARVKTEGVSIVILKDGKPLARLSPVAAISTSDGSTDELGSFPEWMDPYLRISRAFADVPLDELEQEVETAVRAARIELAAERSAAPSLGE